MNPPPRLFRWRSIIAPALLPTLLFSLGEGALLPLIPALAQRVGADLASAGLVAAMLLVGTLIADVPAGWIVARLGEKRAMLLATAVTLLGVGTAAASPNVAVLGLAMGVLGAATAIFALARHSLLTTAVPAAYRARALSTLGGTFRLGLFLGPFLSAALITLTGDITIVYWLTMALTIVVGVSLLVLPDPEGILRMTRDPGLVVSPFGVFRTVAERRHVLARLGTAALFVAALRAVRQVILPLWAVSIGLAAASTALIIGIAGGVDFALFFLGGWLMDRFGRSYTAVPAMLGLGSGLLALALSAGSPDPVPWFVATALWLSVSNGIGAGILMTMGADLAGRTNPAPFLGAWRLVLDTGSAGAPLLLSAITALGGLALASGVLGGLGLVGAGLLAWAIPRFLPRDRDD